MAEATPRINAELLEHFSHKTVRIVGKVRQIRGETADCHLQNNHAIEIIGKVQQDLSVKVLASTDFGPENNIDFNAIDAVVDATHRYHEIFYQKDE
ncbi:Replication factor A protein 3, partial [Pseudocercospora fuligena]